MARSPLASFVARCGAVKGCPAGPHDTPRAHRDSPSPPLQHAPRPSPAPTLLTADDLLGLHDEVKSRVEAMLHRKGATPDATVAQAGDEPVACGDEACVVDGMGNQPVWRIYLVEVEGPLRLHGIAQLSLGAVGVDWAEAARAHVDRVLADASQRPCSSLAAAPGARARGAAPRVDRPTTIADAPPIALQTRAWLSDSGCVDAQSTSARRRASGSEESSAAQVSRRESDSMP